MMNNLHINLNEFTNASRVLKQTKSLVDSGLVQQIYISALLKDGLDEEYSYDESRHLKRFSLRTRNLNKTLFIQIIKYIEFCFLVYFHYKNKNIKIINVHSLALLPLGVFLKYMYSAKLVYDTHELETESNSSRGLRKRIGKILERILIRYVDMTLVVSESIADWYSAEYSMERPPVIMNAPNKRELKANNYFREQLKIRDDQLILLYQGRMLHGRGIEQLLEAFKKRLDSKIVIVFMGYGEMAQSIKNTAEKSKSIFFFSAVSPEVVLEYTASADLGVALIENTCLSYYFCMPNKVFEYAMTGLPILVSNMKDMSELIITNKMGEVINDFSVQGINQAIDNFLTQDLGVMKANAYNIACEYSWEKQEEKMIFAYKKYII